MTESEPDSESEPEPDSEPETDSETETDSAGRSCRDRHGPASHCTWPDPTRRERDSHGEWSDLSRHERESHGGWLGFDGASPSARGKPPYMPSDTTRSVTASRRSWYEASVMAAKEVR